MMQTLCYFEQGFLYILETDDQISYPARQSRQNILISNEINTWFFSKKEDI